MIDISPCLTPTLLFGYLVLAASISGAIMASSDNNKSRGYGYCIWLFSNAALGWDFYMHGNIPYTLVFVGYEILNLRGLRNNWFKDKRGKDG